MADTAIVRYPDPGIKILDPRFSTLVLGNAAIERIATGWRLKPIADPIIVCTHAQSPEEILGPKQIPECELKPCEELGASLASGMALGIF